MDPSMTTMVAFDIETLGLKPTENHVNPLAPPITAVCLYSTHPDRQKTYIFRSSTDPTADQAKEDSMREELFAELDAAPRLCAFNGIRFDIPFMRTAWNIVDCEDVRRFRGVQIGPQSDVFAQSITRREQDGEQDGDWPIRDRAGQEEGMGEVGRLLHAGHAHDVSRVGTEGYCAAYYNEDRTKDCDG